MSLIPFYNSRFYQYQFIKMRHYQFTHHSMEKRKIMMVFNHIITVITNGNHLIMLTHKASKQQHQDSNDVKFANYDKMRFKGSQLMPNSPAKNTPFYIFQNWQIKGDKFHLAQNLIIVKLLILKIFILKTNLRIKSLI